MLKFDKFIKRRINLILLVSSLSLALNSCYGSSNNTATTIDSNNIVHLSAKVIKGIVGDTKTLDYSFITSDGLAARNLTATINKATSTATITGNKLECSVINNSADICSNTLSYTPNNLESGYLTLTYSYTNSVGEIVSGYKQIAYNSSESNQVKVTATNFDKNKLSTTFPLEATINKYSLLYLTFATYDGSQATDFKLDTTNLPGNKWSIESGSTNCSIITHDNNCSMTLKYSPNSIESGTMTLNYQYIDSAGNEQKSNLQIPYRSYKAWQLIAHKALDTELLQLNLSNTATLSNLIFINDKYLTFLIDQLTFQLNGSDLNIINSYGQSYDGWGINSLIINHQAKAYQAIVNQTNSHSGYLGIMVRQLVGNTWQCLNDQPSCDVPIPRGFVINPSLAIDNNDQLFITASDISGNQSRVLKYNNQSNKWEKLGFPIRIGNTRSATLAIDNNNNIYAGYDQTFIGQQFNLYKYTGAMWQKLNLPSIGRNKISYDQGAHEYDNIVFDHSNNLYMPATTLATQKNIFIKYDGRSWYTFGNNKEILNREKIGNSSYFPRVVIDKHDNIYMVVNNGYLNVYKYNKNTNQWSTIGQRGFNFADMKIDPHNLGANRTANLAISPDGSKLYVVSINTITDSDSSVNVYTYDLK